MAKISGRRPGRAVTRLAAAAITAALVATGAAATSASAAEVGDAPLFGLQGLNSSGTAYTYVPLGDGTLSSRVEFDTGMTGLAFVGQVDHDADNLADGRWQLGTSGNIWYYAADNSAAVKVGYGWDTYNTVVSVGQFGGAEGGDLLARDKKGDLYLYLGYGDGTLTKRLKVGYGWDTYTQIAGNGDLDGDGKGDLVARDKSGVLWLYKGTGNQKAPYAKRTKIGSGWNQYNTLFAAGDLNMDGRTDLVARNAKGELYLYAGTGNGAAPYKAKALIGTSGWNTYRLFF
ncbi:FG-GAP-like repeat-containing protein [Streptomyces drozdowiczii]|uniref:FG-GAP-like repeat-containing protein n=1 Tax=Streptomyces drozdowiczii TaxID=202862 RepID=A0ABY6PNG7_9ACTN|nr:FG-GAP-like repeat-containing protein [Streptomyces drozdowiczii]MCX0246788.1 FG-GAP-like repeat-containing protein [Streptomyces drozdowiczii]UZK53752.1 FG-GAP-like repeat-containing protein [Streptomyces drozdowiczii]